MQRISIAGISRLREIHPGLAHVFACEGCEYHDIYICLFVVGASYGLQISVL
jgi:hypothetical protein